MKKTKDLGKKNEVKVLKKKSDNMIAKDYVKKVNDNIKKSKSIPKTAPKIKTETNNNKSTDEQITIDGWNIPYNYIIFYQKT